MSYANVMSTIAVVLALGGGAYAASKTTSKTIKNNTIKSIDQKDGKAVQGVDVVPDSLAGGQILESSLARVPSASSASNADSATTAESAETADHAADADTADEALNGIEGYGLVAENASGNFLIRSGGLSGATVVRQSTGIYCFDGLPGGDPRFALVAPSVRSGNEAQDNFFSINPVADFAGCPGDEDLVVESRDDTPDGAAILQDAEFYVAFF
jgi:hypothetical protein